jgi:uncharacterized protein
MGEGQLERVRDAAGMIAGMSPRLVPGVFVFRTVDGEELARLLPQARAVFREDEGVSVVVPGAPEDPLAMRQITLDVHSALDGVGLTVAVASALAAEGIPCNMIAAHHHDHVFVPAGQAERAVGVLRAVAAGGGGR